jgi:GNAT superfamily N-acetyltransferase
VCADSGLVLTHYQRGQLDEVRPALIEVYAGVYAEKIAGDEFYSLERFGERLRGHTSAPNWEAVVGAVDGQVVGYAYGYAVRAGRSWWAGLRTPVEDESLIEETGSRTFGLAEFMVKGPWRKTGIARMIHDELLAHRAEERVALLVHPEHPRVRGLYEDWGYRWFGSVLPFPDAPLYDAMVKPLSREATVRL